MKKIIIVFSLLFSVVSTSLMANFQVDQLGSILAELSKEDSPLDNLLAELREIPASATFDAMPIAKKCGLFVIPALLGYYGYMVTKDCLKRVRLHPDRNLSIFLKKCLVGGVTISATLISLLVLRQEWCPNLSYSVRQLDSEVLKLIEEEASNAKFDEEACFCKYPRTHGVDTVANQYNHMSILINWFGKLKDYKSDTYKWESWAGSLETILDKVKGSFTSLKTGDSIYMQEQLLIESKKQTDLQNRILNTQMKS